MKVAIIGSRSVGEIHYPALCQAVPIGASIIVSGGAKGADLLARKYADENGLAFLEIQPDYCIGRYAPLQRNKKIVDFADYVIALWDGTSMGTARTIDYCIKSYTPVRVYICHAESPGFPAPQNTASETSST